MKRKWGILAGAAVLILAAAVGGAWYLGSHVWIGGTFLPTDTQTATVKSLTQAEADRMDRLPQLRQVEAWDCTDYQALAYLQRRRPECQVAYQVRFGGVCCDGRVQELTVTDADPEELMEVLPLLPRLEKLTLEGKALQPQALLALRQQYPELTVICRVVLGGEAVPTDVASLDLSGAAVSGKALSEALPLFTGLEKLTLPSGLTDEERAALEARFPDLAVAYQVSIGGKSVSTDAEILDLSDTAVSLEELSGALPLFTGLRELTLTGTGLTDEACMAVADSLPGVLVRCELPLAGKRFLTDSSEIDISQCPVTTEEVERMLPYFPRLEKLVMSFCGIENEEMDALNQRHPDISIVWTVVVGSVKVRTDAIYFYPAEINYYPTNEEMKNLRYCTEMIAVDIGHTRASDCEWLAYMPHVKYLILADTNIRDISPVANLKELIYLELFSLDISDYSPLLSCTSLQDLNIGTTHADPEPLSKMTWLHNLQWHRADYNPDTREAVLKLEEQLPDTNVVLYPKKKARNIGGPWRYLPNYYVFRDIIGARYFNQDQIADYWGEEDGARIMACEHSDSFVGYTLAEIVKERMDSGMPIIGIKNIGSEKAEILYQSLLHSEP